METGRNKQGGLVASLVVRDADVHCPMSATSASSAVRDVGCALPMSKSISNATLQSRARPTQKPNRKGPSGDFCVRVRVRVLGLVRVRVRVRVLVRVQRDGWGVEVDAGMRVVVGWSRAGGWNGIGLGGGKGIHR